MADPIVQFVDSPSTTATLRYDCSLEAPNFRSFPLGAEGIDFGAPPFTGDPGGVGAIYGYRSIRFTQRIIGTKAVALARMSALAKEMLRSTNWLRFQWDPSSSPVWFKTYATEPGDMSLENAGSSDAWDITVPLVAEPFAYGPKQTLSTVQIIQAPADLTGPTRLAMRYVLPTIKGDAPTNLRVAVTPVDGTSIIRSTWLIASSSGTSSMSTGPVADIGTSDGFTAGSGTGAGVSNASYFNGSYRLVTIPASAGNFVERIRGPLPSLPIGRYKVLLRCEADATGAIAKPYTFGFGVVTNSNTTYNNVVRLTVGNGVVSNPIFQGWVDLGEFDLPLVTSTPTDAGTIAAPTISVAIGTPDSTAGTVRIDALKLIPVDGPTVTTAKTLTSATNQGDLPPISGNTGVYDGDLETQWYVNSTGSVIRWRPEVKGAYPVADPAAAQNVLTVMAMDMGFSSSTTSQITNVNSQAALDVSYYPRWLHIGDGT